MAWLLSYTPSAPSRLMRCCCTLMLNLLSCPESWSLMKMQSRQFKVGPRHSSRRRALSGDRPTSGLSAFMLCTVPTKAASAGRSSRVGTTAGGDSDT
eukprot:scaffold77783_cov66-Phaeocystis_antarctica.AAC.4